MKPSTVTSQDLFGPPVRYLVPLYQRPYVWERKRHWQPLWQDVEAALDRSLAGERVRGHFLGAVVVEQEATNAGEIDRRLVIDGQQRMTTLQLLLAAAAAQATADGALRAGRLLRKLTLNDEDLADGDERFKVWPTNVDRAEFAAVVGDGAPTETGDTGIGAAYHYFRRAVRAWAGAEGSDAEQTTRRYEALRAVLSDLLQLVTINLEPGDDAQVIFETLNARGTPLLAMDLVKNAIFHRAEAETPATVDALHHEVWEPELGRSHWREPQRQGRLNRPRAELFLMHWLTMRLRTTVPATELFATFREQVLTAGASPTPQLIAELCADARTLRSFDDYAPATREGAFFHRLAVMDTTTVLPLVLLLFRSEELTVERRARALAALESWLVRRMLCGLTSKNYNRDVIELLGVAAADLANADEAIVALLDGWTTPTNRWPGDEEVVRCLTTRYTYGWIAQRRIVMVLDAIERERRRSAKSESIIDPDSRLSIEHVMPQEWATHWPLDSDDRDGRQALLHHLGNLTLVTGSLNSAMSNGPWTRKRRELYEHSMLRLNAELAAIETWDEDAIAARSRSLAHEICQIWQPPPTVRAVEQAGSTSERRAFRWTIGDLIENGKLSVGERLLTRRAGVEATAIVDDDGTLEVDGELFRTPTAAAKHVTGNDVEHGWRFWVVERDDNAVTLETLRAELGGDDD